MNGRKLVVDHHLLFIPALAVRMRDILVLIVKLIDALPLLPVYIDHELLEILNHICVLIKVTFVNRHAIVACQGLLVDQVDLSLKILLYLFAHKFILVN